MDAIWLYAAYWERILKNTEINKIMKKICLLLFLLCACIAKSLNRNVVIANKKIIFFIASLFYFILISLVYELTYPLTIFC